MFCLSNIANSIILWIFYQFSRVCVLASSKIQTYSRFAFRLISKIHLRVDIFHHLELTTAAIDLGDGSRGDLVHQMAQHLSILEDIFEGFTWWEFLAQNRLDPFLGLFFLLWVTLCSDLQRDNRVKSLFSRTIVKQVQS